jgi:hypothetical protein
MQLKSRMMSMITLHVAGQAVGTASDLPRLLPELLARKVEVELRDESGKAVGRLMPPEPLCPWEPELTREELNRRSEAGGGIPLSEFWKRMGAE